MRSKLGFFILFVLFVPCAHAQQFYATPRNNAWELCTWTKLDFTYISSHGHVYSTAKNANARRLSTSRIVPFYNGKIEVSFDIYNFRGDCSRLKPGDSIHLRVGFYGKGHRHHPLFWDTVMRWPGVQAYKVYPQQEVVSPGDNPIEKVFIRGTDSSNWRGLQGISDFYPLQFIGQGNPTCAVPDRLKIPASYYDSLWIWNMRYRDGSVIVSDTIAVNYSYRLTYLGRGEDGHSGRDGSNGSQGSTGEAGNGGDGGDGGWHGGNGLDIQVYLNKLPHRDLFKVKVVSEDGVKLYYINLQDSQSRIVLDVSGGHGGEGGDGGDGGAGGLGDSNNNIAQGIPGPGGGGGDGGNGGKGGCVVVFLDTESKPLAHKITVLNKGGNAGRGGDGGSGAPNGDDGSRGDTGEDGPASVFQDWEP